MDASKNAGISELDKLKIGLISLCYVAKTMEIQVTAEQLFHSSGLTEVTDSTGDLIRAAAGIGIKAKPTELTWERLSKISWPAIAQLKNGQYISITRADHERITFFDPTRPQTLLDCRRADFEAVWGGRVVLTKKKNSSSADTGEFGLRWFIREVAKHHGVLIEIFIAAFVVQIFGLALPISSQIIIDKVLVHRNISVLDILGLGVAILIVFEGILSALQTYLTSHTAGRIDAVLSSRVMRHLLRLPLQYFESRQTGIIVAHMRELETVRQFITGASIGTAIDCLSIFIVIPLMFMYSQTLSWIALLTIPLFLVSSVIIIPLMRERLQAKFECGAASQSFLVETISGIHTIKALAIEPMIGRKWGELLAKYISSTYRVGLAAGAAGSVGQFLQKASSLAVLWVGANLVVSGQLSVGHLVAFQMLSGRLVQPIVRISQLWQEFQQVELSISRIADIMNNATEHRQRTLTTEGFRARGNVEFSNVSFRYAESGQPTLSNICFKIKSGQSIGIVGRSGSGKSTIAKLIQCMYLPVAGRILLDDMDVRLIEPSYLRSQIGVVLQENFLFNGTIRSNVAINDPTASIERIIQVAKIAGAHDFIMALPDAYDTAVGERGVNLSGGQRQRIAIARALLNNPRILIFDEATSALDYESERVIQANMEEICRNRTVFIIAHRLSTVRHASSIIVLDKGVVAEVGSHEELLGKNGIYAYLHSHQIATSPVQYECI